METYFVSIRKPDTADRTAVKEFVEAIFHLENKNENITAAENDFTYYITDAEKAKIIPDKFTKSNDIAFTISTGNKELDGTRILIGHIGE